MEQLRLLFGCSKFLKIPITNFFYLDLTGGRQNNINRRFWRTKIFQRLREDCWRSWRLSRKCLICGGWGRRMRKRLKKRQIFYRGNLSELSYIIVILYQSYPLSELSYIKVIYIIVILYQSYLISELYYIRVILYQSYLISELS